MRKSKATEAKRVATDIAAIRGALKKRGYTIRKQPKQAAWSVSTPHSPPLARGETAGALVRRCYLLSYQPAPISAWVLHPQSDEPNRQRLLTIIQKALAKQPTSITQKVS
jgi:hypothetical protein